jgi:hypothetical protein
MKISAKGIGVVGLLILLFGCFVVCTMCAVLAAALDTGLSVPTFASYSLDGPVPSLGQLNCPMLLSKNEPATVAVSISNPSKLSQQINLSISKGNLGPPIESDAKITLTPLESTEKKWSVRLESLGNYSIWVRMKDLDDPSLPSFYYETYCIIGVIETFGLTAAQFQTIGFISIILGVILVAIWLYTMRRSKKMSPL